MSFTDEEWAEKVREIPIQKSNPKEWPTHVRPISIDDEGLGIDREGVLYWNGKPVMIRRQLELRWYELILATVIAVATVVQAVAAVVSLL